MKLLRNFGVGLALGTLTAAGALLADTQAASAQAPPGFIPIPGTQTSLLITGSVGTRLIYDFGNYGNPNQSGASQIAGDVLIPFLIPVHGEVGANDNGKASGHFSNIDSSFGFITATPTAWGNLETTLIIGTGNNGYNNLFLNPAFPTSNVVVGFGTLGPFMAGLNGTLFGDADADPEHIEPFGYVAGDAGGLAPGFRYTWTGPGGWSIAGSVETDNTEGMAAGTGGGNGIGMWNNFFVSGTNDIGRAPVWDSSSTAGGSSIPDFILRGRLDQPWGHISLAGVLHENNSDCSENCSFGGTGAHAGDLIPRINELGYGLNLSGHLNTWGKDSLKAGFVWGSGLGFYMGEWGGNDGLIVGNNAAGTNWGAHYLADEWGIHASYTHFWTDALRSSFIFGYARVTNNNPLGLGFNPIIANIFFDKSHISGAANLIWSPVPKVDLGIEYVYFQRNAFAPVSFLGWGSTGKDNRISTEAIFHF